MCVSPPRQTRGDSEELDFGIRARAGNPSRFVPLQLAGAVSTGRCQKPRPPPPPEPPPLLPLPPYPDELGELDMALLARVVMEPRSRVN